MFSNPFSDLVYPACKIVSDETEDNLPILVNVIHTKALVNGPNSAVPIDRQHSHPTWCNILRSPPAQVLAFLE